MNAFVYHLHVVEHRYLYMKSLSPKGAKSNFVTSEKNALLCANLYTRLWETQHRIYNIFFSFCSLYSDQKCVLKVGGKLNNVRILATRFFIEN